MFLLEGTFKNKKVSGSVSSVKYALDWNILNNTFKHDSDKLRCGAAVATGWQHLRLTHSTGIRIKQSFRDQE